MSDNEKLAKEGRGRIERGLGIELNIEDWAYVESVITALLDHVVQNEAETGDAQRCCFEPVSDYLSDQLKAGVPCYEDVVPAIKALIKQRDTEWERVVRGARDRVNPIDSEDPWKRGYLEACDEILEREKVIDHG